MWLHFIPGIQFRTNNTPFKNEMERFLTKIVTLMKDENLFASQGGPIILSQVENEYGSVERAYGIAGELHVKWAASTAIALNTSVPWVMCSQADAPDPIVPWSKLGQEPVLVYLDRILVLAEPATQVEGCCEDSIQEAKKIKIRELEQRLLEHHQELNSEMNASWLGSLVNTIIGNIKLSITNVHIRYEDIESNPGHPFAAGLTLKRLSAVTVDDSGNETFATGGALERIQKSVELDRLSFYFDSDIEPWLADKKPWSDMHSSDWNKMFEIQNMDGKLDGIPSKEHNYVLQPVTGSAKYTKLKLEESKATKQALQQAAVNLDDVTLCLSKYLKVSIDEIVSFFKSNTNISQTLALETAAAMQMTIDGVKRSAQQQVTRVLKDKSR